MSRRQYQIPRPPASLAGATVEQTYVFPLQQPPRGVRPPLDPLKIEVPPFDAPAPQQTYVFALSQPLNRRSYQVRPSVSVKTGTTPAPSAETIFTAPVIQTHLRAWVDTIRYRQDVTPIVHQGPQVDTSLVNWQIVTTPTGYVLVRQQIVQTLPMQGAPAAPVDTDVYRADAPLPLTRYGVQPDSVLAIGAVHGIAPAIQVPLSPLHVQPARAWWIRVKTHIDVVQMLDGPTAQQSSVFPIHQPSRTAWYVPRAQIAPGPRLDGPEPIASSLFVVSQPQGWTLERVASRFVVTPQLEGAFVPPAVPQTYLFPPDQPSRTQWYVPRTPSEQVPAPVQIMQGASVVATEPIPAIGGSAHTYWPWRYQIFETCTKSLSAVTWSAAVVIVIPPLAAADACDTFTIGADRGPFVLGADAGALMIGADRGSFIIGADPGSFLIPGCGDDE